MSFNNTPIDVICMIDKTGKITPIKVRIENDDSSILVAKINEVVYSKENHYAGITTFDYGCKVSIDELEQLIELRYNVLDHVWKITKVIGR